MNELTDAQVAQSLEWLRSNAEAAKDFTVEQAPLYFQELVHYTIISSAVWVAAGAIVAAFAVKYAKVAYRRLTEDIYDDAGFVAALVSSVLILFTFMALCIGTPDLLKATLAPRVLILEHLTNK